MRYLWLICMVLVAGDASASREANRFMVPGVDLAAVRFDDGAWCRYRVIDQALGQTDTSEVYIAITDAVETGRGPANWIEIETRFISGSPDDRERMKLLVLHAIRDFAEGDSLGDYVVDLYIQKGEAPPEHESPDRYADLSLAMPRKDPGWMTESGVTIDTPAGQFVCSQKRKVDESHSEIPRGAVTLVRSSVDDVTVWFADGVPVFRMAKCAIERFRQTETRPKMPGIPTKPGQISKTLAELMEFGSGAKSILPEIR